MVQNISVNLYLYINIYISDAESLLIVKKCVTCIVYKPKLECFQDEIKPCFDVYTGIKISLNKIITFAVFMINFFTC